MGDTRYVNEHEQKIVLVLLNIVNAIVAQAIFLSPLSNSINAKVLISIDVIFLLVYLALSIGVILSTILNKRRLKQLKDQKRLLIVIFGHIIITVGGLAYLTGDDITALFVTYQSELNCGTECLEIAEDTATVFLVVSLLLFRMAPTFLSEATTISDLLYSVSVKSDHSWSLWKATGRSIALIVELDAWFSVVSDLPTKSELFCPPHELLVSWVLYGFSLFIWALVLGFIFAPGIIKVIIEKRMRFLKIFLIVGFGIIVWFSSANILIADNAQPIGCLFECDITAKNHTTVCNDEAYHGTRMALLFLALIPIITISLSILTHWVKKIRPLYSLNPQESEHVDIKESELKSLGEVEERSSHEDIEN